MSLAALNSFKMILDISSDGMENREDTIASLWEKAWSTWVAIGNKSIIIPPQDSVQDFLASYQSQNDIDKFFNNIPSQTFLINYLEVFPFLIAHYPVTYQRLTTATSIFRNSLLMPVSKEVSPFLVPSTNDSLITSLQRNVLSCIVCMFTSDNVFDDEEHKTKNSLINKSKISNIERHLTLFPESYPLMSIVINELLLYSSYSWTPPQSLSLVPFDVKSPIVNVNMNPFSMSCLTLSLQLLSSYVVNNKELANTYVQIFIKVNHNNYTKNIVIIDCYYYCYYY